jgi:hypothetical protein
MRTSLLCAVLVGVSFTGGVALAQDDLNGGAPGEWLSRYSGARTMGLGGAYVASVGDPLGMLWNPAGVTRMFQNEASFEVTQLFEDTSLYGFGLAIPNRTLPSFALGVVSLRSGEFEKTNELNEPMGEFREGNVAFLLSASKQVHPRVSLGMNAKVVRHAIDEFDAAGFGTDFGLLFDVTKSIRLGASLLNVAGPKLTFRETAESYPSEVRSGWRWTTGRVPARAFTRGRSSGSTATWLSAWGITGAIRPAASAIAPPPTCAWTTACRARRWA